MKKIIFSVITTFVLSTSLSVMAQDNIKKSEENKPKTECKKACDKNKECTSHKKACDKNKDCAHKDKKTCDKKTSCCKKENK